MTLRTLCLLGFLALAGVLGFLVFEQGGKDSTAGTESLQPTVDAGVPGLITVEGWQYREGDLERTEDGGFRTHAGISLEQIGLEVEMAPGAEFRIEGGLPILDDGSMQVRAKLDTDFGPFRIPAGSSIEIRGEKIIVGTGGVLIDGTMIPGGATVPRTRATEATPGGTASRDASARDSKTDGARASAGMVIDGANGRPIAAARVRVTISDQPEGDPRAAGVVSPSVVITDNTGRFDLPPGPPGAVRLWLRIEVDAPGYAPVTTLTEELRTLDGTWPFVEVSMRRTWITDIDFRLEDESPIANALIRVVEAADPYIPEDGPLVTRQGDNWISHRTTDDSGRISAVRGTEHLTLVHPTIVPFPSWLMRPLWAGTPVDDGVTSTGEHEPIVSLHVIAPTIETFELVDADETLLADTAIEVSIPEDGRIFRVRTDELGRFTVGVSDRPPGAPDVVELPKAGSLVVLDPRYRSHSAGFMVPSVADRLHLNGRASPLLSFELVEKVDGSELRTVPAEQVTISLDLTPLEFTPEGRAVFTGALPDGGEKFFVAVRDYLPLEVRTPSRSDLSEDLDLGTLVVAPGEPTPVILPGVAPSDLEGAVLEISGDDEISTRFLYPLKGSSRLVIGGIDPVRFYRFRVTGPWLDESSGEFRHSDDPSIEGLSIPTFSNEPSRVVTRGVVASIPPWETDRYRIIERGYRGNEHDPVIERSYPLAPDGTFGSERYRDDIDRFEAILVGGNNALFAHAPPQLPEEIGLLTFPQLSPENPRIGRFFFRFPGAGLTLPPEVWCEAARNRDQELLSIRVGSRSGVVPHVEMRFFLTGDYSLHWESISREDGVLPFKFAEDRKDLDRVIDLPPAAVNLVALTVLDHGGEPVSRASVSSTALDPAIDEEETLRAEEIGDGVYLVTLYRDLAHRISVRPRLESQFGLEEPVPWVGVEVTLPVGGEITEPFRVREKTSITGVVHDPSERPLDGTLTIVPVAVPAGSDWPEGTMIRYGSSQFVALSGGEFIAPSASVGENVFEFRHEGTSTGTTVDANLAPEVNQLAPIVLGVVRTLRGAVIEAGDIGVSGAEVMLVEPGSAYRYPGREPDTARIVRRVKSGAGGVFSIELQGIRDDAELSLVARHPGHTAAVLNIVDLDGPPPTLFLREGNTLRIRAVRNGDGEDVDLDRFRLTYLADDPVEGDIDLGEVVEGTTRDYSDVRPGRYRLEWGPEDLPLGIVTPSALVSLGPGHARELELQIDADIRTVIARRNGLRLVGGWVLVTDDPTDAEHLRAGRIVGGVAKIPVPKRAGALFVSATPARVPEVAIDFALGSALPRELPRAELHADPIRVEINAYDLSFTFNDGVLLSRNPVLVLPRWVFKNDQWKVDGEVTIPITGSSLVIPDLAPGIVQYTVESRGPGGWSIHQSVELVDEPVTVPIIR